MSGEKAYIDLTRFSDEPDLFMSLDDAAGREQMAQPQPQHWSPSRSGDGPAFQQALSVPQQEGAGGAGAWREAVVASSSSAVAARNGRSVSHMMGRGEQGYSMGPARASRADVTMSSPSRQQRYQHDGSRHGTARMQMLKMERNVEAIEEELRKLARDVGRDHVRLTLRLLAMASKHMPPPPTFASQKNWFAGMKLAPVEGRDAKVEQGLVRMKWKHHGQNLRAGKIEKRENHRATLIKTNGEPVPHYSFHHVEIAKNIISPNTMLSFVPHLRDLAAHEEPKYRNWLENLERMDKTSGFATLSRQEKVEKTVKKERATRLLLYLDHWLDMLAIENCSKSKLARLLANHSDASTAAQKSSMPNPNHVDVISTQSAKTVRMFTEAFDRVFTAEKGVNNAVTLRDVLLLDNSAENMVDTKKSMKETPVQAMAVEEIQSVESFLETYALLGCLVCGNHSCEHGDYGVDNERKRFSVEVTGGLEPLLRQILSRTVGHVDGQVDAVRKQHTPCGADCHLFRRPRERARVWNETETMLLKTFLIVTADTRIAVQCAAAVATGRPCWDASRQIEKLELAAAVPVVPVAARVKVKAVPWYDRWKKMLFPGWQEQTITHEHQRKDHFDPCSHDGPCTQENCPCVQAKLMCERFCRCSANTCATKFTGCACHSLGKTCMPLKGSNKQDRPCICVQLNRECDPSLCHDCGALERANPRNADNDELYTTGCQNCSLQRGKCKKVVLGKSMIENCGYGLFAAEDIAEEDFVIEYVGELISQDEGVRREARRGDVFNEEHNSSYLFTLLEQEGIWVDAAVYGNMSRYINHQTEPRDKRGGLGCNITPKILYVGCEYRIRFTAMRDIKIGEELFFNYGENFPNLTKKLLDEQEHDEKNKDHLQAHPTAKYGITKEGIAKRKPGRKPGSKNKAFAQVVYDPEDYDDDLSEPDFADETLSMASRKRKRIADSDVEDEYQPDNMLDSDAQSVRRGANVSRKGANASRSKSHHGSKSSHRQYNRTAAGLFSTAHFEVQRDSSAEAPLGRTTPKRHVKKSRKLTEALADALDVAWEAPNDPAAMPAARAKARTAQSVVQDEPVPTRRSAQRSVGHDSSPLTPLGHDFEEEEDVVLYESAKRTARKSSKKRISPSSARPTAVKTSGTGTGTGPADNDSDEDNTVNRSQSRIRRPPSRYRD